VRALLDALYGLVANAIETLHTGTGAVFGENSGISWALAIVLLTICVRLLMYPLFLKQIKTQRTMQMLQPKIKELQKKHKGDRETLNAEMMKLYREHNANPFAGCLPMILQMPVFIALFQVLNQLAPDLKNGQYVLEGDFGLSLDTVESLERAKIFGAPIGAGFTSPAKLLDFLGASAGPVKVVAVVLIIAMAATTFFTSRQMMGRNPAADSQQATQQKILLYVMPVMLGLFGFNVAIGVLIYWTTTNLFSMGQQTLVMRRLGPVDPNARPLAASAKAGTASAATTPRPPARTPKPPKGGLPKAAPSGAGDGDGSSSPGPARPQANRKPNTGKSKRKGQRRGGRR
jgi:YidC/Oxa1 family membrane protein insertase